MNYLLEAVETDLLDVSTWEEEQYINGETRLRLKAWEVSPVGLFTEGKVLLKLSDLPESLQIHWGEFNKGVENWVKKLKEKK